MRLISCPLVPRLVTVMQTMQAQSSQRPLQRSPSQYSALVDQPDSDDGQLQSGDEDDNGLEELGDGMRTGKRKRPISVSYVHTVCSYPLSPTCLRVWPGPSMPG